MNEKIAVHQGKENCTNRVESDPWVGRLVTTNQWIMRVEAGAAMMFLILILLSMSSQVIARYGFRSPFSWSEELARFAMIWLAFIAAPLVMAQRGHITVDLWTSGETRQLPKKLKLAMDCLVDCMVACTCLLLLVGGIRFVWYVHPVASPSLGIPKSFWYGAVSTGLALMAVHSLLNLLLQVRTSCMATDIHRREK